MKKVIFIAFIMCASIKSNAQLSTIFNEFIPAYEQGDVQFIQWAVGNIEYLKGVEKTQAQKMLTLFKVLTINEYY